MSIAIILFVVEQNKRLKFCGKFDWKNFELNIIINWWRHFTLIVKNARQLHMSVILALLMLSAKGLWKRINRQNKTHKGTYNNILTNSGKWNNSDFIIRGPALFVGRGIG